MHGGDSAAAAGSQHAPQADEFDALGMLSAYDAHQDATGEWVTTDRDTDRAHSCETDLLTVSGSAEPPPETPHAQLVPPHDEPAVDPASRLQRPPNPPQQHLVIVANRLPVNLTFDASTRTWSLPISSGGLVSALMGHTTRWVGWPGECLPEGPERDAVEAELRSGEHACAPVWIPKDTLDLYYNGFCKAVLWQLFHYVPVQMDFRLAETHTLTQEWLAYQKANELFADAVAADYREGDVVWIQDYHLMLLPEMLKQRCPTMKVGFFLHTPFPSSEIYRTLPYREQLLRGVLKADLIGFHTYDYVRHFISSCTRILGLEGTPYGVEENGSLIRVAAFPIGIDPYKFEATLRDPAVADHIRYLKQKYSGLKVMLGVDRLDMIKGIPQKLLAFEKFLEDYEDCRSKVVLVQIAVPSRLDVPEYQQLRSQVHEIVGRINGRFGTLTHVPIHHLDRKLTFKELCALYAITDVALVTSLRDGMNLVSYEFVACQAENAGVLVLSEFAGAAQSLGAGSILVNPWNLDDMTAALHEAVRMSPAMRRRLWKSNYQHVSVHTAQTWGDHFIMELNETCTTAQQQDARHPPTLPLASVAAASSSARKRLIVLGYNAALKTVVSEKTPRLRYESLSATSGKAMVDEHILQMLHTLAQDSKNVVVIVSGATTAKLCSAFLPLLDQSSVWLAAENGAFMRPPRLLWDMFSVSEGSEWICLYENLNFSWVKSVEQVFEYFSARTPRSVVETRETSVVWNYKHADYEFGKSQAQDMLQHLLTGSISNSSVDVVRGARSVEVRMHGVNKGVSMSRVIDSMAWLLGHHAVAFDFVLCIGHFMPRDETIFSYFEGKDIVNADQGTAERPSGMTAPGATPAALDHINPYAPAAPPNNPPTPPSIRQASQASTRPRISTGNMGSRVWTMDSFDVDDQTDRGTGNSYDGEAPRLDNQNNSQSMHACAVSPTSSAAPSPLDVPSSPVPGAARPPSPSQIPPRVRPATHPGNARPDFRGTEFHTLRRAQSPPPGGRHAPRGHSPSGTTPFVASSGHFRHSTAWASADQRRSTSSTLDLADTSQSDSPQGERAGGSSSTPRGASGVQANVFPPTHLFTVTMGRSRSVARYCVDETKIVSRILECICNPHWSGAGTSSGHSGQDPGALGTPVTSVHLDSFNLSGLPTTPASLATLQPDGSERVPEVANMIPAADSEPAGVSAAARASPGSGSALHGSSSLSVSRTAQDLSHALSARSGDPWGSRGGDLGGSHPSTTAAPQPALAPIATAAPAAVDTATPPIPAAGALGESVAVRGSSQSFLGANAVGPPPSGNLLRLPAPMNAAAGQSQQPGGRHSIADAGGGAGGGGIDGRNSSRIMHNPATGQEGRSTLFDAMGRPVPLSQAYSAAASEMPSTERAWTRRNTRVTSSARSVHCFEPTYEPENRDAAGDLMPSIRSESDLASLAPPPTLRLASLDLPALRSVGYGHAASVPHMQALERHAEDGTCSGDSSMPSTTPSSHAQSARARTCSASGFMFGSLSAGCNDVRRQSMSTGLPWSTHAPLPEDSTLRLQLPPRGTAHDCSVFSRGCTSVDDSNCTNTSSRPSGSALSAPVTYDVTGGTDDATGSFEYGTGEGSSLHDLMVSSHAIHDLRREESLPRAAPE